MVISLFRFWIATIYLTIIGIARFQNVDFSASLYTYLLLTVICVIVLYRADYLNPLFAFCWPWIAILSFVGLNVSEFSRPISNDTIFLLLLGFSAAMWGGVLLPRATSPSADTHQSSTAEVRSWRVSKGLFLFYLLLLLLQIAVAGFIPLVRGVLTGDTGYFDFGIHSIYGFFNALSCAIAASSFFFYSAYGEKKQAYIVVFILFIFIMLVTRQNVMTVVFECSVIHCIRVRRVKWMYLIAGFAVLMIGFSAIGELRSGDIRALVRVTSEFNFLPNAMIWIYAYMYFNVLNLDNVLTDPGFPYFDGSSFADLLPSVFRPEAVHQAQLEVSTFTVGSFYPAFVLDVGFSGVFIFLVLILTITNLFYEKSKIEKTYIYLCCFSTLYYCCLFSFFAANWVYLPVIAQLPLFTMMNRLFSPTIVRAP
jgi:oligosaccharide repeat unit polymerase